MILVGQMWCNDQSLFSQRAALRYCTQAVQLATCMSIKYFHGMPVAGHSVVCPGFLFHRRHKWTNLTTSWFDWLTTKCTSQLELFSLSLTWKYVQNDMTLTGVKVLQFPIPRFWQGTFCNSAILVSRGNKQKVRHFRRCFNWNCKNCIEFAKQTNKFSNQTCVFIWSMCLTFSLNKEFDTRYSLNPCIQKLRSPSRKTQTPTIPKIGSNIC